MNREQYINRIVKKIKCGRKEKKEIKKQLLTDINFRLEQGELLTDIMLQMGSIKEIADDFNENLPETEKKKYARAKIIKIIAIVFVILVLAVISCLALAYYFVPKGVDIEQSEYFDKAPVEQAIKDTIELFDNEDYDALRANATEEMEPHLVEAQMDEAKAQIARDWGQRKFIGTIYVTELTQRNSHYAYGEVTVTYENVSVVYSLTYDTDMKLAGFYMR